MRGDAEHRASVHFLGAYLNFDDAGKWRHDGRMERLVAIRFRESDIVLEFARQRPIGRMYDAERRIAILNGRHDKSEGGDIVYQTDIIVLPFKLLVQAPKPFHANIATERSEAFFCKLTQKLFLYLCKSFFGLLCFNFTHFSSMLGSIGVDERECKVFKRTPHLSHPQAVGDMAINLQCFYYHFS